MIKFAGGQSNIQQYCAIAKIESSLHLRHRNDCCGGSDNGTIFFIIGLSMMEEGKIPDRLHFRLYASYIQASKQQLQKVNKQSYYHLSVWENDKLLGEMMEGSSPAILSEKIFLTKAAVNFSQRFDGKDIVIKLTEYYTQQTLLGIGMFNLAQVKQKFVQHSQRFNSLLEVTLTTPSPSTTLKLVFSIFVERGKYELDQYIKRFKENEKDVLRAKRNINNYKKEMLNKSIQRDRQPGLIPILHPKKELLALAKLKPEDPNKPNSQSKSEGNKRSPEENAQSGKALTSPQLQINSAAKIHPKGIEKKVIKERKPLNEAEEKQFQAYSTIMEEYNANSHFISALDMETPSVISDGSEESQMRAKHERETYSEKAIKKFKGNVNIFVNVLMVIVAILLISFVITPTKKYSKVNRSQRKSQKDTGELFDI